MDMIDQYDRSLTMKATYPTTQELRKALNLPASYKLASKIDAPQATDNGRNATRFLYVLKSSTPGHVTAYAAWMMEAGIVELTIENFRELASKALGIIS